MGKLWEKGVELDKRVEKYTVGDDYLLDRELVKYDCLGSIAHAKMLGRIGIVSDDEMNQLIAALQEIIDQGGLEILPDQEDCHTAIENFLTEKLGEVGKKIHTARSRNDQVLTALRLYYLDKISECRQATEAFVSELQELSDREGDTPIPGYTHMRKAMPSSVAIWCGAFVESAADNLILLKTVESLMDQSPLGTAAGYGVPLDIDRQFTAHELGFSRIQENPLYAQMSRGKFEVTLLHALGQIMFDLNKIASDLILFSMPEFGFFTLPEQLCTGSSIMPQKQNPDMLEIMRGKFHMMKACEREVSGLIGDLGSGFHRDFQLTKGPTMKGIDITLKSLEIASLVVKCISVNGERCEEAMTDDLYATERAYNLVKEGVPFREAYRQLAEELREKGS
ncbi:MAG: argininosuccinate lyase [Candidatus Neomarinimicrobiota bacterium]|nr:argininosuccinate lyase [Candidatus Neomarinimicrobiota bacterium]